VYCSPSANVLLHTSARFLSTHGTYDYTYCTCSIFSPPGSLPPCISAIPFSMLPEAASSSSQGRLQQKCLFLLFLSLTYIWRRPPPVSCPVVGFEIVKSPQSPRMSYWGTLGMISLGFLNIGILVSSESPHLALVSALNSFCHLFFYTAFRLTNIFLKVLTESTMSLLKSLRKFPFFSVILNNLLRALPSCKLVSSAILVLYM